MRLTEQIGRAGSAAVGIIVLLVGFLLAITLWYGGPAETLAALRHDKCGSHQEVSRDSTILHRFGVRP